MKFNNHALVFIILTLIASLTSCSSSSRKTKTDNNREYLDGYLLATPDDPPPSKQGPSNNIYYGRFKTCTAYSELSRSQLPLMARLTLPLLGKLQDLTTVDCKTAHTCDCYKNEHLVVESSFEPPLYRCVESSSAQVENEEIYKPNESFSGDGVIKFALPRSVCNKN